MMESTLEALRDGAWFPLAVLSIFTAYLIWRIH